MLNSIKKMENTVYKTDLRVLKTYQALSNSLIDLLRKQPFDQINVKTICDDAMVSRSSFYSHFEDKYHLLLFCFEEAAERIKTQADAENRDWSKSSYITEVLVYIKENQQFMKMLFNQETNSNVRKTFEEVWLEELTSYLQTKNEIVKEREPELQAVFLAGGITRTIYWWVDNDCETDVNEVATQLMTAILF